MTGASAPLAIVTEVLSLKTIVHPSSVSTTSEIVLFFSSASTTVRSEETFSLSAASSFLIPSISAQRSSSSYEQLHVAMPSMASIRSVTSFLIPSVFKFDISDKKKSAASSWQDTAENSKRTFAHLRNFAFRDRDGPDGRGKIAVLILARSPAGNKSSVKCERQVF